MKEERTENIKNITSANWWEIHSVRDLGAIIEIVAIDRYTGKIKVEILPNTPHIN